MTITLVTCPKCNGSGRRPVPAHDRKWVEGPSPLLAGYDKATDTLACDNCGGQTMSCIGTGKVRPDPKTGVGCLHAYSGENAGRCLTRYTCKNGCGDNFYIDSGD